MHRAIIPWLAELGLSLNHASPFVTFVEIETAFKPRHIAVHLDSCRHHILADLLDLSLEHANPRRVYACTFTQSENAVLSVHMHGRRYMCVYVRVQQSEERLTCPVLVRPANMPSRSYGFK